jgi:hypothetical protein
MGIDFFVTEDENEFKTFEGAKINYSETIFEDAINIKPHFLLFEDIIRFQEIAVKNVAEWSKIFFENQSNIPFDIFAASFYLLSRYEEFLPTIQGSERQAGLPHKSDEHGRYQPEQSLAVKNNFIEIPLVDIWAKKLKEKIISEFPQTEFRENQFKFISTIDIDFAYKYKGINFVRQTLKFGKSLLQVRFKDCIEQLFFKNDPYDTYDFIQNIATNNQSTLLYFILMRTGTKFDKNISPYSDEMKNLVEEISEKNEIGLHPSYFSDDEKRLKKEKTVLENISQKNITKSRQHFLKFNLPETYRQLIKHGITDDYSMAYSAVCGFRASTSFPFYFFDLVKNEITSLTIHPTTIMDVTLKNHQNLSPEKAIDKIETLMDEVKKVNGTFISLWHNSNLCLNDEWKMWREVYTKMHSLKNN